MHDLTLSAKLSMSMLTILNADITVFYACCTPDFPYLLNNSFSCLGTVKQCLMLTVFPCWPYPPFCSSVSLLFRSCTVFLFFMIIVSMYHDCWTSASHDYWPFLSKITGYMPFHDYCTPAFPSLFYPCFSMITLPLFFLDYCIPTFPWFLYPCFYMRVRYLCFSRITVSCN